MFDPTSFLLNARWGYVCVHTGADYNRPPRHILYNPLRWEVGIGRNRPCWIVINEDGRWQRGLSNLTWRLWRKRLWEQRRGRRP